MNVDMDRLMLALTLLLAGFIIVFVVLILLIIIITIYGKILQAAQGASEKRKKKKVVVQAPKPQQTSAPVVFGDNGGDGEIPGEIIAVIAAAVDAVYGSSAHRRIRSVKRSSASRSAWGRAGIADNTRPF